jgi:hypothetical protein
MTTLAHAGSGLAVATAEGGQQFVIGCSVHDNLLSPVAARV